MGKKIEKSLSLLIWNNLEDGLSSGTGLCRIVRGALYHAEGS